MKSTIGLAAMLAISAGIGVGKASGPVAVFALVESVTYEPSADKPERIRITGVFSISGPAQGQYSEPQRGYLYFAARTRYDEQAFREWADIKSVAGTRQIIGFGAAWTPPKVRIRRADEEPKDPDEYLLGNGVAKVNSEHPRAKALLEFKEH
jgi:hypothetical protein